MSKNKIVGLVLAIVAFTAIAPTLTAQTNLLSEDFEGSFPPSGWTQNSSFPTAWRRNDTYTRTNYVTVGGAGGYCADRDDDRYNIYPTYPAGAWFQTPAMNCTGYTTVWLSYSIVFNAAASDRARIEVSNNGTTWTQVVQYLADVSPNGPGQRDSFNISAVAAGQPTVYVRFTYWEVSSTWAWWLEIDRVRVWGSGAPVTRQPDSWVKNSADPNPAGYIGNNIYEYPTPSGSQTKAQTVNPGSTAIYNIRLTNDGSATDSFRITGPAAPANWTYTYYDALTGGNNITAAVTGSGWNTGSIATTGYREIRVEVTPAVSVPGGTTQNVDVTSTSINDGTKRDVVRCATTTASARQPDNHIKLTSEAATAYIGDNVYNLDGTSQTKSMFTDPLQVAGYHIRIQNDGNSADNMTVLGTAGNANFTVNYYDALTGGTNITSSVTGAGWATGSLAVGATREIRCEVTPTASAPLGSSYDVLTRSRSNADTTKRDVAKATTTVINHRPDNHIKNSAEAAAAYIGDNVYNTDGANQTKSQNVDAGATVVYHVRLQNDGNYAEAYTVTGTGSGTSAHAAWTVRYYNALTGGTEITSSVTGAGWTSASLAPGATAEIRCEVTPNAGAWGAEVYNVLVTTTAPGYGAVKDAVRAATTVNSYFQPDNLVKRATESSYIGDGIYNADGTDQTSSYVTNYWKTSVFHIKIENDSNTVDAYNVTGTGDGGGGWTVKYYDALTGGTDITGQITGAGWSTGSLDPDGSREIRVEMTGGSTADTSYEVLVTSTSTLSTSNTKEFDAVKCLVVTASAQPDAMIKNISDTTYVGDNVYNQTGEHQTKEQTILIGNKGVFHVQVQNDYLDEEGNPDVFIVKATAGNASWNLRYFDLLNGGADITASITGTGWTSGEILPLNYKRIRIEVVPDTTLPDSSFYEITIKATSTNDGNRKDVVKAIPVFRTKQGGVEETPRPTSFSLTADAGRVQFALANSTNVSLKVYDAAGNLVATLASGRMNSGIYTMNWQAPSRGVYFVKLSSAEYSVVRKVTVLR